MDSIAPFIKLGWNTVPLKGALERLEDGSKTVPVFEKGWKEKYKNNTNTIASRIGGVMTGLASGIIAIDCDNDVTYELFKSLDPDYAFEFKSKGKKGLTCGTFIYSYDGAFADSFGVNDGIIALDFYSNSGFVYLPTSHNHTKEAWSGRMPALKAAPAATLVLLSRLAAPAPAAHVHVPQNVMTASCLAPLVKQFTTDRQFMPGLFKILTPKSFRSEAQYAEQGFLHPKNIPEGRGSEYLSKMSAILGADVSIDEGLYCAAMHDINAMWTAPMDADRLDGTIIDPMINGKASVDGVPIWQYDENWSKHRCILHTKRQSSIELGFDDRRNAYYCVDAANEHVMSFASDDGFSSYINSVAINPPAKKVELKTALPMINVTSVPQRPFGFFADADPTARTLNTFIRTPELVIMEDPKSYAAMYKRPETTLKFFNSLVPEDHMREYLLSFLKRKLTTFEYSPVVLYFLGVHGSGKDTFVAILEKIMGKVARPTTREFLELFNGWILDSYFIQLDEYGNQLTTMRDRDEALGKLKSYTGKQNIQIRQMRTDGFIYAHNATFVMTANSNPFGIEDGDRRIALFNTPNVLTDEEWVDDMSDVHRKIMEETKDFCYYLATQVKSIGGSAYTKPPESVDKQELIASGMHAAGRLAYVLKHRMFDHLKDLADEHNVPEVTRDLNDGTLWAASLETLYDVMTEFHGNAKALNKVIRANGIAIKAVTSNNTRKFYYKL